MYFWDQISSEFCRKYYQTFDNDFTQICKLYNKDCKITYLGNTFNNPTSLVNYIKTGGSYKFTHHQYKGYSQPLSHDKILIQIVGTISANNSIYNKQYCETLIIQRDFWSNWTIINSLFVISS